MRKLKNPKAIMLVLAAIVLLFILVVPLGVGEGGSQHLLLQRMGFTYPSEPQSGVIQIAFGTENKAFYPANAHEALIRLVNVIPTVFDLRVLGIFYSILLLFAMYLLMKGIMDKKYAWHQWLCAILIVLLFCDFAYTTYFNSWFWYPLPMVLLLLSGGLFAMLYQSEEASIGKVLGIFCCGMVLAFINTTTALLSVLIGFLLMRAVVIGREKAQKMICMICGMLIAISGVYFAATYKAPSYESDLYSAVFLGTTQFESVAELGLEPKLDELKGVFYSPNVVEEYQLKDKFYDKIDYGDILKFYITHPKAAFGFVNSAAANGFNIRLAYLGNYTNQENTGELAKGFNLYSYSKGRFMPNTLLFVVLVFAAYFIILFQLYLHKDTAKKRKLLLEMLILLGFGALIGFKLPYLQTGLLDIGKSMFLFYFLFDLMILAAISGGSLIITERRQNLKDKYGVRQ